MSKGRGSYRKRQRNKKALMAVEDVCWLCLEPMDFAITDIRNPDYIVLDEIVPVAKGGDPEDIRNQCLVHRKCNARKGARILPRGAFAKNGGRGTVPQTSRYWFKR